MTVRVHLSGRLDAGTARILTAGFAALHERPGEENVVLDLSALTLVDRIGMCVLGVTVLIRSGPGPKLQAAERQELVAFEVDDLDEDGRSGWSVVIHGRASRLPWSEQQLDLAGSPWATGPRRQLIRIRPRRVIGRRIHGVAGGT